MKINKLIPILSTTAIVGVVTPLVTSCGKSWIEDDDWKPTISQYQTDQRLDNDGATAIYFPEAIKNKKIILEDFYWSTIGDFKIQKQHYIDEGYKDVDGSIKVRANKVKLEERKHTNRGKEETVYLLSGEFEYEQTITYTDENDPHDRGTVTYKNTTTSKTVWDKVNAGVEYSGQYWTISCFHFLANPEWKWYSSLDQTTIEEQSWDNNGSPITKRDINETHSVRTSDNTQIPQLLFFSSYFLNNVKTILGVSLRCEVIPPELQHLPILENRSVTEGQPYESNIRFEQVGGYDFSVTDVHVGGTKLTKGTDWVYTPPTNGDQIGHIKINDGSKVTGNITIYSKYSTTA